MEIQFLTIDEVLEIHSDQINLYGGSEGIRDPELLLSAIAMPYSGFGDEYFHKDIYEMAAAYLFHITNNHPFIDGNKRTGVQAAYVFLRLNDFEIIATNEEIEKLSRGVAEGRLDKKAVAQFLRDNSESCNT